MSLVFAAITPHPPFLAPNAPAEQKKKLKKTASAFTILERELYGSYPDTILIVTGHVTAMAHAFVLNASPKMQPNFSETGDFKKYPNFQADTRLAANIKEATHRAHLPLQLHHSTKLDHGSSLPLFYLAAHLPKVKVITIGYSLLPPKDHFDFGYILKDALLHTTARCALIASGDLSHCLTSDAPGGFSPAGKKFDEKILEMIQSGNATGLMGLDTKMVKGAEECALNSLLIFFGALQRIKYIPRVLAYEHPFGVGYLTAEMELQ
ncbi:MAG: AMMECR1 domain protein [Candidatus Magasanikbacteria bacterium]|nr:AMMECR1 domain protein [Candidatus Magasanikbacteria bacterium]